MRSFTQIVLTGIVSLATWAPAHADLFISRKHGEVDYLVQTCRVAPTLTCSATTHFSRQQLKTVRRKIHWGLARRLLSYHLTLPMYMRSPGFLYTDIEMLWSVRDGINHLLQGLEGVVQVPTNAPGSAFIDQVMAEVGGKTEAPPAVATESVPTS